jgi:predicted membrane-bound spermidine synthase
LHRARVSLRIWSVAFVEGFSTLSVEVIAIRLAIPVVGSSMTLTGIVLGTVLFALSAGYWRGGELSSRWTIQRIHAALARNLLLAAAFYVCLTFPLEATLLEKALALGLSLPLALGGTAAILFVLPVYLASQTVPMLAELTNTEGKAGKASGKVLFCSTLGSVAGGIVTPVYLFPWLGVQASTYVVGGLLIAVGAWMAFGRARPWRVGLALLVRGLLATVTVAAAVLIARSSLARDQYRFAFDSPHQSIRVLETRNGRGRLERIMILNGARASGIYADTGESFFAYVREADHVLTETHSETVLAIGAAGFTFPRDAAAMPFVARVDAVDVDPSVREIAERHFLLEPLPAKVRFYPISARSALREFQKQGRHYDFTLLDAYNGEGIPDELLTTEFFRGVRAVSGRVAANMILDTDLESEFARNVLASFREAFGGVWVKDVHPGDTDFSNYLVTNWSITASSAWHGAGRAYSDNRNSADRDHIAMIWSEE